MKKVTLGNLVKEYAAGTTYEQVMKEHYPEKSEPVSLV